MDPIGSLTCKIRKYDKMKWEYQTIKVDARAGWTSNGLNVTEFDKVMNRLGSKGWELVSAFDTNMGEGRTEDVVAIFKRPAED